MPQQPQKPSSSTSRQRGFSLMELMIALMIIGVIATLGFKAYGKYSAKARYTKAQDTMKTVAEGLDQYYLKYGKYPDLGSFEAMVDANSPLVKQSMVPVNTPGKDMWDQPFEGKSTKATYELKCLGDPTDQEDRPPFTREPGKIGGGATTAPSGEAAGGTK
ncbi:type IV pilin protein [Holophaga foetida]|uniref:type IV pilin protein n=1 Tax=Holophaga foetida TaxID=35839 RepID=UPI0002472644|nr:type II secretion system protein [Holophaga foetida]